MNSILKIALLKLALQPSPQVGTTPVPTAKAPTPGLAIPGTPPASAPAAKPTFQTSQTFVPPQEYQSKLPAAKETALSREMASRAFERKLPVKSPDTRMAREMGKTFFNPQQVGAAEKAVAPEAGGMLSRAGKAVATKFPWVAEAGSSVAKGVDKALNFGPSAPQMAAADIGGTMAGGLTGLRESRSSLSAANQNAEHLSKMYNARGMAGKAEGMGNIGRSIPSLPKLEPSGSASRPGKAFAVR